MFNITHIYTVYSQYIRILGILRNMSEISNFCDIEFL